jgi:ubiquitin carboxyl-terminal hydrolase 9/24
LHTNGFRPDLSRRSIEARIVSIQGREQKRESTESVAMDCVATLKNNTSNLGKLADLGLFSFPLYSTAYAASEALAEILLAAASYGRDNNLLVIDTLKAIYSAPAGWVGTETLNAALMVLRSIASIPDDRQNDRISFIMNCNERPSPHAETGIGLLSAARTFYSARSTHSYPNEIIYAFDRYVNILKDLLVLPSFYRWMTDNRNQWVWLENDLLESHQRVQSHEVRGDYVGRRAGEYSGIPLEHHQHSDTDDNMPGMNDSEDDEEDESHYDEMETYHESPGRILVEGAGNPAVNGVYAKDGYFERACKFSRAGDYNGQSILFSIFQCNVSNNTKHWYISIVPQRGLPGTSADVDFYSAPVTDDCADLPPLSGWTKSNEGKDPSPILAFTNDAPGKQPEQNAVPVPRDGGIA